MSLTPPRCHTPELRNLHAAYPPRLPLMPSPLSSTNLPSTNLRRYWFQIESTNQIQCVWAVSFTEAKQKAALRFLPHWRSISWLQ
jgi:hypothetical protein